MQNKVKGLKDKKQSKLRRKGQTEGDKISDYIIKGELIYFMWETINMFH